MTQYSSNNGRDIAQGFLSRILETPGDFKRRTNGV